MESPDQLPWSGTVTEWLRSRLLHQACVAPWPAELMATTNWISVFIQLMKNRMELGYYRYGHIFDPAGKRRAHVTSAKLRLDNYLATGNLECLVDVANLCMIEYHKGQLGLGEHPSPVWDPQDDGVHTDTLP